VPLVLATAIARAMALAPEHRFSDAAKLAAELRVAVPVGTPERRRSLSPRGLRVVLVIAVLACVFFAAGYLVATRH
jgi:hypothetical protein